MLVFGKDVPLINSALGREEIIRQRFGIDNVVFIHFNQHVMRMPWDEFIDSLIRELNISWIVVGHDFCFGYKGEGTAERLKAYSLRGARHRRDIIPAVTVDGRVVSSTHIRELIAEGEIEQANRLLRASALFGRYRAFRLPPRHQDGHADYKHVLSGGRAFPKHGVARRGVYLEGGANVAVTNVGVRPTVSSDNRVSVESFLLDYSGNLYGRQARVDFYSFIRPERRFDDFESYRLRSSTTRKPRGNIS